MVLTFVKFAESFDLLGGRKNIFHVDVKHELCHKTKNVWGNRTITISKTYYTTAWKEHQFLPQ